MPIELDALAELAAKATARPWKATLNSESDTLPPQIDAPHEGGMATTLPVLQMMWMCHASGQEAEDRMVRQTEDDCSFIVAAANYLTPARIAELQGLKTQLAEAMKLREEWSLALITWNNTDEGRTATKAMSLAIEADNKRIAAEAALTAANARIAELDKLTDKQKFSIDCCDGAFKEIDAALERAGGTMGKSNRVEVINELVSGVEAMCDEWAAANARIERLEAAVTRYLEILDQRSRDEREFAAAGTTYTNEHLSKSLADVRDALAESGAVKSTNEG